MCSVRATIVAGACLALTAVCAQAKEIVPDSTGWYQVSKGRVIVQTVVSAKLPLDSLVVVFTAEDQDPQAYLVNQNLMLVKEQTILRPSYIVGLMPTEIRWHRSRSGHRVEWAQHGRTTRAFRLPASAVKTITYCSHDGRQWGLSAVDAERMRPMYEPARLPPESGAKKKHHRFIFF